MTTTAGRPKLSIHPGLTDLTIGVQELAAAAAERGIEGFYLPEHTHIPVDYDRAAYPEGKEMPERYKRVIDPYIGLAFVAAGTDMDIGTIVSLVANHDVVALAKTIATLDHLSGGGRFSLGIGAGWCPQEFETHRHLPGGQRHQALRETVEVLRLIWTEDVASYEGTYYSIPPLWSWPKPQTPIPILLGGPALPRTYRRVAAWADGWITMAIDILSPEFVTAVADLTKHWEEADRDPADMLITTLIPPMTLADLERVCDTTQALGVDHVTVHLEDTAGSELYQVMDDLGTIIASRPR